MAQKRAVPVKTLGENRPGSVPPTPPRVRPIRNAGVGVGCSGGGGASLPSPIISLQGSKAAPVLRFRAQVRWAGVSPTGGPLSAPWCKKPSTQNQSPQPLVHAFPQKQALWEVPLCLAVAVAVTRLRAHLRLPQARGLGSGQRAGRWAPPQRPWTCQGDPPSLSASRGQT